MTFLRIAAISAAALSISTANALADGDAAAGEKVFKKCQACHVVDEAENKVGPHLVNVFGRTAGGIEDFKYSKAMAKAGEEGLVWNDETMAEYLAAPRKYIKGTKMSFAGLKKEEDVADIIAYLKQFSEEADAADSTN